MSTSHFRKRSKRFAAAGALASAMFATVVNADALVPGPDTSRHTIDGGGGRSSAETIELSIEFTGTIGQVEALDGGPLVGAGYTFSPGYWNDHAAGVALCPADITGDGLINVADLMIVIANWGAVGAGDTNNNGTVDVSDLLLVISNWGSCPA